MAHKVPPDVLSEIFILCLPELPVLPPSHFHPRSAITEVPFPQAKFKLPSLRVLEPPFSLATVCRYWRDVVYSTARLWTQLNITIHSPNLRPAIQLLLKCLSRSAQCPLEVFLAFYTPQVDGLLSFLLDTITAHGRRFQHFELYAPRSILYPLAQAFFLSKGGLPMLQSLHLNICPVNTEKRAREGPIGLQIPRKLAYCSLRGAFSPMPPTVPQYNLRMLFLDMPITLTDFLGCIPMYPLLEELSVLFEQGVPFYPEPLRIINWLFDADWHGRETEIPQVTLPRLQKFHIGWELKTAELGKALGSLVLPSLQHLIVGPIDCKRGPDDALREGWNGISSMLNRSNADLISLRIQGKYVLPHEELVSCLKLSPNLTHLSSYSSFWTRELAESLTSHPVNSSPSLPLRGELHTGTRHPPGSTQERDLPSLSASASIHHANNTSSHSLVPLLQHIIIHGFHNLKDDEMKRLIPCLSSILSSRRGHKSNEGPGGGGTAKVLNDGSSKPELGQITFECRNSTTDIYPVITNANFTDMVSAGLAILFSVLPDA